MFGESLAKFFKVDSLISNLTGYVETKIDLIRLEAKEELSKGISAALVYAAIAFVVALGILFLSVALALLIGRSIGNTWGFTIVGGVYVILGIALIINHEKLKKAAYKEVSVRMKTKK